MAEVKRCFTVPQLARRWRCRDTTVRAMVKTGLIETIRVGRDLKITPEVVEEVERGVLAVKPRTRKKREAVPPAEVTRMLDE